MANTTEVKKSTRIILLVIVCVIIAIALIYALGPKPPKNISSANQAPMVDVVLPAQFSPEAERGQIVFVENCQSCHGANAAGQEGIAPPLVHIYYEPNHHSDVAFMLAMARGVQAHHWTFGNMPPVQNVSEAQAQDVIAYVREIQRANGIN